MASSITPATTNTNITLAGAPSESAIFKGRQYKIYSWGEILDKSSPSTTIKTTQTPIQQKQCGSCKKALEKVSRCGRCKIEYYCNAVCQKSHWPTHKKVCQQKKPEQKKDYLSTHNQARSVFSFTSTPSSCPKLTDEQIKDAQFLIDISPLDSILDKGKVEARCKQMGQAIFDKYKQQACGDSFAGKQAAQDICNWVRFNCNDGHLRKQYIEHAWGCKGKERGIGDENWFWMQ